MTDCILYILILAFAAYGFKKGMPDSGMLFIKTGAAAYLSIWLLPPLMPVFANLPPDVSPFAFCGAVTAIFIIVYGVIFSAERKITDNYPAYDSAPVFSSLPLASSVTGTVFGAFAGYAAAAFVLVLLSLIPAELPMLSSDSLAASAKETVLGFTRKVNFFAGDEWNAKQEEIYEQIRAEYAKVSEYAPEESSAEKPKTEGTAKQEKTEAPAAEETTPAETTAATSSSLPLPQRIASKAVSGINNVSDRQMAELGEQEKKAPVKKSHGAVTFSYTVKVLKADGSESDFSRELKLAINLPEDGKIPVMIDAEVPFPVLRAPGKTIVKTERIDLSLQELTRIKAVPEQSAVKYTIVNVE